MTKKLKILSLDIASTTGWCISKEIYGTWNLKTLKDESMGMKLLRYQAKLKEIHEKQNLDLIVYERPAGRHANSIIHQSKLIAVTEQFCELHDIEYKAYSAKEIKKYATGSGNASKSDMIKAAKSKLGYTGNDDNEADALFMRMMIQDELNE